jgi:hypothetical protein
MKYYLLDFELTDRGTFRLREPGLDQVEEFHEAEVPGASG